MRPIDRFLRRETTEAPAYAVRPFGTTAAEAQATDAAADSGGDSGTAGNLTTGGVAPPRDTGEIRNRGDKR